VVQEARGKTATLTDGKKYRKNKENMVSHSSPTTKNECHQVATKQLNHKIYF